MNPTDWIRSYEASEPRTCFWCRFGGVVFGMDPFEALACRHAGVSTWKKEKKSTLPVNWDGRPWLKCVSPDEACENWAPTKVGSHRMRVMEAMGMFDESRSEKRQAESGEALAKRRKVKP